MSVDRAAYLSGVDPDYSLKDLYEAIANRKFVSIRVYGWFPKCLTQLLYVVRISAQHNFWTGYVKLTKIVRFSNTYAREFDFVKAAITNF